MLLNFFQNNNSKKYYQAFGLNRLVYGSVNPSEDEVQTDTTDVAEKKPEQTPLEKSATSLEASNGQLEKMRAVETSTEKQKPYKELRSDYDAVFDRLLKDPEFKHFYERSDGSTDPQLIRENQQLFFAILAKETNNFQKDFVLSKFTNDNPEANKKNYPYIYHEWVKDQFDTTQIDGAKAKMENKAKEAGLQSPDENENEIAKTFNAINIGEQKDPTKKNRHLPPGFHLYNPLDGLPTVKNKDYYEALKKNLGKFKDEDLRIAINKLQDNPALESYVQKLKQVKDEALPKLIALAKAQFTYEAYKQQMEEIDSNFITSKLGNRQKVIELAMKQYQKAMTIVDTPFEVEGSWHKNNHPAVRRMLISMVYQEGVARLTPSGEYKEDVNQQYKKMFTDIATSKYFNADVKNKFLESDQREFLIVARYSNLALYQTKYMETEILPQIKTIHERVKENIAKRDGSATDAEKQQIQTEIDKDIKEMNRYTVEPVTEANVLQIMETEEQRLKSWQAFSKEVTDLMQNPDRQKIHAFMERIKNSKNLNIENPSNEDIIKGMDKYLEGVDLTYNTFDLKARGEGQYLEAMGINPEYVYGAYREYFTKHPEMKVDQWEKHSRTPEGTKKLVEMFRNILPDSSIYKGKEDFLKVFATLHGQSVDINPPLLNSKAIAMNIFFMVRTEVEHSEKVRAATIAGNEAAVAKLQGQTFGDKITDTAKGVFNMFFGPGQSIANRIAGGALILLAYKAAKSAYKGEGNLGKLLRVAFVAGSAELALKHLYGEGLTDKLRLNGLADALGGTYESVLLDRAKQTGENITETEHAAALMELRKVPFNKVMEWYENTDIAGNRITGKQEIKLPKGIDIYNIVPGKMSENKELHARLVLKKTIKNFCEYVGNKDEKGDFEGKETLKGVWITAIKDNKYKLNDDIFAKRGLPPMLLAGYRANPNSVTWQEVMQNEIRPSDVEKVKKKGVWEATKDAMETTAAGITRWSRRDLEHPASVAIQKMLEDIETEYGPKAKEFVLDMGEAGATQLVKGERYVSLMYQSHKYELKRFAAGHWDLVTETVKLPLSVLYGVDKLAVPFFTTRLKQLRELLASRKLVTIEGRDLGPADIMRPEVLNQSQASTGFDLSDKEKNPEYLYFGVYQVPFYKALQNKNHFYKTEGVESGLLEANIGYYISETTETDAKIKSTDSSENKFLAMDAESAEQAKQFYMSKGASPEMINKYMYPIHSVARNDGPQGNPQYRLYTFWRMPMPESQEYTMKERDLWQDYDDPNDHKFRPPFKIDPSKGILENLKNAYGAKSLAVREGVGYLKIGIAEWARLMMGTLEVGGKVVKGVARHIPKVKVEEKSLEWITGLTQRDEKTLQKIDEWAGTGEFTSTALSEFYKESQNAKNYKKAAEFYRKHPDRGDIVIGDLDPDGNPWVWTKVKVDTGALTPKGDPVYRKTTDEKGKETDQIGRLNPDDYKLPGAPGAPEKPIEPVKSAKKPKGKKGK
jgi:hypothetical protein